MKPFAERFYHSRTWQQTRDAYFVSQHGLCEKCGNAGLIVHHKIELTPENIPDPDISLNWDNLELVCLACHNNIHHGGETAAEGLVFDADGNLVQQRYSPLV